MGPTKFAEQMNSIIPSRASQQERPRRGSLPELKTQDKMEKKVPTGPKANPLYKTRLCMNFQTTGSCPYTEKCQFAHGVKELEKWENWRNSQKDKTDSKSESVDEGRSRSQSEEKVHASQESHQSQDLVSSSLDWELSTPIRSYPHTEELPRLSISSNFSLWSLPSENGDSDSPFATNSRARASTFDCTYGYDNMAQLKDAPTLFPSPPVLANLARMNLH